MYSVFFVFIGRVKFSGLMSAFRAACVPLCILEFLDLERAPRGELVAAAFRSSRRADVFGNSILRARIVGQFLRHAIRA